MPVKNTLKGEKMQTFSVVFTTCFMFLGAIIWLVGMMIVIVGSIGVLRVAVKWAFEVDVIEWYGKKDQT